MQVVQLAQMFVLLIIGTGFALAAGDTARRFLDRRGRQGPRPKPATVKRGARR